MIHTTTVPTASRTRQAIANASKSYRHACQAVHTRSATCPMQQTFKQQVQMSSGHAMWKLYHWDRIVSPSILIGCTRAPGQLVCTTHISTFRFRPCSDKAARTSLIMDISCCLLAANSVVSSPNIACIECCVAAGLRTHFA